MNPLQLPDDDPGPLTGAEDERLRAWLADDVVPPLDALTRRRLLGTALRVGEASDVPVGTDAGRGPDAGGGPDAGVVPRVVGPARRTRWATAVAAAAVLVAGVVVGADVLLGGSPPTEPLLGASDDDLAVAWRGDLGARSADTLVAGLGDDPVDTAPAAAVACAAAVATDRDVVATASARIGGVATYLVEVVEDGTDERTVLIAAADDCRLLDRVPVAVSGQP